MVNSPLIRPYLLGGGSFDGFSLMVQRIWPTMQFFSPKNPFEFGFFLPYQLVIQPAATNLARVCFFGVQFFFVSLLL